MTRSLTTLRKEPVIGLAVLVCLAVGMTLGSASAAAQGPGLPRTYQPQIIDTPNPIGSASFGWGVASADLTGDGHQDLVVPQSNPPGTAGQLYIFNGVTRQLIDVVDPPERNPDGALESFAYVYVETMPDLGSCPQGPTSAADQICNAGTIGPPDGIPEIIAGSRALKVNAANPATPATANDPALGRGYVFDGATRAVLKRIDMPAADRAIGQGGAQFARMMMNPSGLPPCRGLRSENNSFGVGDCPERPRAERIGDADGQGQPDIVITARSYRQPAATAFTGSPCRAGAASNPALICPGAGKAWLYSGEAIVGSNPRAILDTATSHFPNPRATTQTGGEYGGNVWRLGDVTGDGLPEFVIPARNLSYPLNNPDTAGLLDVGASFMWSAKERFAGSPTTRQPCSGEECMLRIQQHPEPQPRVQFPNNFNSGRPTGNLGATDTPDFLQPSPLQNVRFADDGRVYVFNGDIQAGGGAEQSFQFAQFDDPTPFQGGTFGGGTTGVGDLVSDADNPANEVLVGGFHFDNFSEVANTTPSDVHFINPGTGRNLMTIPHPTQQGGDGFGIGMTPMGDLNDDGFLDFAVTAYLANVGTEAAAGRAYVFYSDNSPAPPLPPTPGERTTASSPNAFKAGACANDFLGTDRSETINGSDAGDRMAGYGGNDLIRSFTDDDCLHGGSGDDRLASGADEDRLLGASGNDRLNGGSERDTLFGGSGRDRLAGAFGRDRLYGGGGNDRLSGGGHGDRLFGERGNDRIHAGGAGDGPNRVDAGPGNDVINVRNKHRDYVRCGAGRDRIIADRRDRLYDCERISSRR